MRADATVTGDGQTRGASEPGLAGRVPFRWSCQRSGRCCTAGEGRVWLEPGEAERLAAQLGVAPGAFAARHLRTLPDPRSGELRTSLREEAGRCTLLEGANVCTVYAHRPRQCRTFPFWDAVLTDPAAFERARTVCPGIAAVVSGERRAAAFAALEELHAALPAPAAACTLPGAEPWITGLEADHLAARAPAPADVPADDTDACPWRAGERCGAGDVRPVACRGGEGAHARLVALARALDYPAAYGRARDLLAARGGRARDLPAARAPDADGGGAGGAA